MITVVCWKWTQKRYRSKFGPQQVRTLKSMVERNLDLEHRFVCITDDARGLENIDTIKLWSEPNVELPQGKPNCYRRLRAFAPDAADWLGERILSIDLDVVITDNITPLVDIPDDFKIWGDTAKNTHYNGGFWLMTAGSRPQVWEQFDPDAPNITKSRGLVGSDQAWISYILGGSEQKWGTGDGVYSFRNHLRQGEKNLPDDARVVFFHGHYDPWDRKVQARNLWIKKHYN